MLLQLVCVMLSCDPKFVTAPGFYYPVSEPFDARHHVNHHTLNMVQDDTNSDTDNVVESI